MYYLRHVTAATTAPLVLAACVLLSVAVYNGHSGSAVPGIGCVAGQVIHGANASNPLCIANPFLEPLNLKLAAIVAVIAAELLFPLFLLVSTVIRNNVKLAGGLPPSVLIACVAFVLTFGLPAILSIIISGLPNSNLIGEWMLKAAAFAAGCCGSCMLYMWIRPKRNLVLRL